MFNIKELTNAEKAVLLKDFAASRNRTENKPNRSVIVQTLPEYAVYLGDDGCFTLTQIVEALNGSKNKTMLDFYKKQIKNKATTH